MPSPSWTQQSARSPASPCSSRTPAADSSPGSGTHGAQACGAVREDGPQSAWEQGQTMNRVRTSPQNSRRQWGQRPTMRNTAWLQRDSDWNSQRFLAAMVESVCRVRGERGTQVLIG